MRNSVFYKSFPTRVLAERAAKAAGLDLADYVFMQDNEGGWYIDDKPTPEEQARIDAEWAAIQAAR